MAETRLDITEILEEYVELLEKGGVPRTSTESKIMLCAKEEIETLRRQADFQREEINLFNKSRLHYMDMYCDIRGTLKGWRDGDRVKHNGQICDVLGVGFDDSIWCAYGDKAFWIKTDCCEKIEDEDDEEY